MKKIIRRLVFLAISIIVFATCTVYGTNIKENIIVYSDGYIDNGNIKTMLIRSYYGFTDKGDDNGIYSGSLGIPQNGKVELRIAAKAGKNDRIFISFKDMEGNVIFEKTSNSIFFSKIIDAQKGEWYFQINGQNAKTGDFKYTVLKK